MINLIPCLFIGLIGGYYIIDCVYCAQPIKALLYSTHENRTNDLSDLGYILYKHANAVCHQSTPNHFRIVQVLVSELQGASFEGEPEHDMEDQGSTS